MVHTFNTTKQRDEKALFLERKATRQKHRSYCILLGGKALIDASEANITDKRGLMHYANHSCVPNAYFQPESEEDPTSEIGSKEVVKMYANKRILNNHEITVDYMVKIVLNDSFDFYIATLVRSPSGWRLTRGLSMLQGKW